ncbi:galactofuranose transport system permease protein [Marmoricola sp. URHA0025 HA25]
MTTADPLATGAGESVWDRLRTFTPPSRFVPVITTFALLVGMFGAGAVRYPGFSDPQVVLNLFIDNSFLIVLAVGMTFVILTGGIDLSVGSVVALSTVVAARTMEAGWPPLAACVLVLLVGSTLGLLMGLAIHYFDVQPFIATLAGLFFARGLCFLLAGRPLPIDNHAFSSFAEASITLPGGYYTTWAVVVALLVVAVAAWVLHRTRLGRTVYAIGGSETSALLMGLPVARVKVGVYVVSGLCSAIAGLLFGLYMLSGYSLHAVGMELDAIAAVVIGGTLLTGGRGFVIGSVLGVLVLGTIQTFISFDGTLSSWWTKISIGVLLLAFVVVQRLVTRRQT